MDAPGSRPGRDRRLRSADLVAPWRFALVDHQTVQATLVSPCGGTTTLTLASSRARVRHEHPCGGGASIVSFARDHALTVRMSVSRVADATYVLGALDELMRWVDPVSC